MRPFRSALLVLLLATSAYASPAEPKSDDADAAIGKTVGAFFAAWNQHDAASMVGYWADDATLINPMGQMAHGKAEIEKLMTTEHATVFKNSTAALVGIHVSRPLGAAMLFCDGEMTVDGAVGPDGTAMPQMKFHLAMIMAKHGDAWVIQDARPYMFLPAPPSSTK